MKYNHDKKLLFYICLSLGTLTTPAHKLRGKKEQAFFYKEFLFSVVNSHHYLGQQRVHCAFRLKLILFINFESHDKLNTMGGLDQSSIQGRLQMVISLPPFPARLKTCRYEALYT
uniref:Uncharacterized protein n=1 Tax=Glossina austeni TaxID=7395 RepID=A0A1A9UP94_GLOAU